MDGKELSWRIDAGYDIDAATGIACRENGGLCTLHFYHAAAGDRLLLRDPHYEYRVALYRAERPAEFLYTYAYQPEESWTVYTGNLREQEYGQGEWHFVQDVYFRVCLRYCRSLGGNGQEAPSEPVLAEILSWHRAGEVRASSALLFPEEIEKTARTVERLHEPGTLSFLLLTDTHYCVNGTWQDTIGNLRELCGGETGKYLCGTIHLGDATDGMVPARITADYVNGLLGELKGLGYPLYYVLGNHDSNYFNNPERWGEKEMCALYLENGESAYYEKYFPEERLRIFFLDSFSPQEEKRYGFSEKELDWLERRLQELPADDCVLICSHVPPLPRLHYWSKEIRGSERLLGILKRFQTHSNGRLLGFVHGHNHADQVDMREGFPIISVGCAKCEYFTDKKPEGAITYEREPGTVTQELWDVLTVNTAARTLDFTRFGAGEDRHIDCRRFQRPQGENMPMKKVITYGTFDLFHEGHYNLLKRARELGDCLIVGVTTEHYDEQRGKFNIVDPLLTRIENVRATGFADEIIIEDHEGQKQEDIQRYGVDIFTLGSDWRGSFDYLKKYCQVVYLERTPGVSSTMLRTAKYPIIRLGIVGTGRIAPRFLKEARYVSGVEVECVYNPHKESAERFAEEYSLAAYSDRFEAFLDAVDAIYIATPHETHYGYARAAIEKGKHVLCEKPLTFSREQAAELFHLAREKELVLMEGIKTAYCPGFQQIIEVAQSGAIGEIRDVEACFSRLTAPNMREMTDEEFGGAFMEFGSYTLLPVFKLLGTDYEEMEIHSISAPNDVDIYTKLYFKYRNGLATSKTGLGVKSEGQLLISGTKGYILAESPWWLTRKFQVRYEDPNRIETYSPRFIGDGLRYEISDFLSRIHGLHGASCQLKEEESIAMIDVVERFLKRRWEKRLRFKLENNLAKVKIWAHRGCSWKYPENTLPAFAAAADISGIAGIELDVQLSKDGVPVVFHDETLDRLMEQGGRLCGYTAAELKAMRFRDWQAEEKQADNGLPVEIPTLEEVLLLLAGKLRGGELSLNIELKNGVNAYEGMEEKVLALVKQYDVLPHVVFSSFNGDSLCRLKKLEPLCRVGILNRDMEVCMRFAKEHGAEALHPYVGSVTGAETTSGILPADMPVRAWNSEEPFYRQKMQRKIFDLRELKERGITDLITNVPEEYLEIG